MLNSLAIHSQPGNEKSPAWIKQGFIIWSERLDSNQRPSRPERDALPGCATLR